MHLKIGLLKKYNYMNLLKMNRVLDILHNNTFFNTGLYKYELLPH